MKNVNFFTAFSGMFDAFRGILRSTDGACRVSATTTINPVKRQMARLLICGLLCAATMTAQAQSGTIGGLSWTLFDGTLVGVVVSYTF